MFINAPVLTFLTDRSTSKAIQTFLIVITADAIALRNPLGTETTTLMGDGIACLPLATARFSAMNITGEFTLIVYAFAISRTGRVTYL